MPPARKPRKPKTVAGHQVKLHDDLVLGRLVEALEAGNYRKIAAGYAEVGERTLKRWMQRGQHDHEEEVDSREAHIYRAVVQAEALGEKQLLGGIRKAGETQWQANAWILERTRPERYARREGLVISGQEEAVGIDPRKALDAELRPLADELLAKIAATRKDTGGQT